MPDSTCFWINGRLLPEREAVIPVTDHGLLYGDGVFEGIRFYHRTPFRLSAHLQRLADSCKAIRLALPYTRTQLTEAVDEIITIFPEEDGYLRLMVTRGSGPMGLNPAGCKQANVILIATRLEMVHPELRNEGIRLIIASTRRLPADGLDPRIKSLNYLNHILARMEATQAGVEEAVLLNGQGRVAEGSAENIFIVQGGHLATPRPADGALAGITRGLILELAAKLNIPAREVPLTPYDLYTADECFMSGTGAELIPVREVDGRPLRHCPGPVFSTLASAFRKQVAEECKTRACKPREGEPKESEPKESLS
ncbi:MAG TPA: branched-chain-amino-acid transaminase [Gammaproteobacteria bacterium]|nr:branched-chain-amino-acid transaminase [Gammaproteobacteria bacterium]